MLSCYACGTRFMDFAYPWGINVRRLPVRSLGWEHPALFVPPHSCTDEPKVFAHPKAAAYFLVNGCLEFGRGRADHCPSLANGMGQQQH